MNGKLWKLHLRDFVTASCYNYFLLYTKFPENKSCLFKPCQIRSNPCRLESILNTKLDPVHPERFYNIMEF